ncbi:membrane protein [Pandoraea sputorum]|uniref:Membrane protein n=1 Tax=Pandoraea sputorum TaxID=93222 RepID=A0A5E5BJX7_9BURK|nr:membrane protein [Pandoraea sputorum]
MTDIKSVLADAEDLLKQAANTSGERASELSAKALALLEQAREKASNMQVVVVEKSKQAARATDDYVHDHPWQAAGVGIGIGVVIGLLLNRK